MPPSPVLPTDLEKLAAELEENADVSPPTNTRALLYRIDERSGMSLHAVGRLAREVSKLTEEMREVKVILRAKADRETVRDAVRDVRKKVDSFSSEVEDSRQIHIAGLQAQLKALEDEKKALENERRDAEREEKHNKEFWKRWFIIAAIGAVTTLTAWAMKEVYTLVTHPASIAPSHP